MKSEKTHRFLLLLVLPASLQESYTLASVAAGLSLSLDIYAAAEQTCVRVRVRVRAHTRGADSADQLYFSGEARGGPCLATSATKDQSVDITERVKHDRPHPVEKDCLFQLFPDGRWDR